MNKLFVMNGGLVALSDDERYVRDLAEEELAEIARRINSWDQISGCINAVLDAAENLLDDEVYSAYLHGPLSTLETLLGGGS